jgi:hypothetical protein
MTVREMRRRIYQNRERGNIISLIPENMPSMPSIWKDTRNGKFAYCVTTAPESNEIVPNGLIEATLTFSGSGSQRLPIAGSFALPDNAVIDELILNWSDLTTPQNIEIGDGSDVDYYATAFTPTLGIQVVTLVARKQSGNTMVFLPAGAATMTCRVSLRYTVYA